MFKAAIPGTQRLRAATIKRQRTAVAKAKASTSPSE